MNTTDANILALERATMNGSLGRAAPRPSRAEARAKIASAKADEAEARLRSQMAEVYGRVLDVARGVLEPTQGSYANARASRLNAYGNSPAGSPDTQLDETDLDTLRRRSQAAVRDNPIARAIISRIVGMGAPDRISFQALTGDPSYNAYLEAEWRDWWENDADFRRVDSGPMLARQINESACRDGDIGINLVYSGKPQIQLVPGELIASPFNVRTSTLVHGVEKDAQGRVVAYHVYRWNQWGQIDYTSPAVLPADNFILARNWRHVSPGQSRGEPLLSGCLHVLDQISEGDAATVVAMRLAACISLIVMSENPAAKQTQMLEAIDDAGDEARDDAGDGNTQVIRPGGILHMKTGEKVEQLTPNFPAGAYLPFVISMLRKIGADVGLPIELFMYDTTETTFYGGKAAAAIAQYETITTWQRWMLPIMTRIFRFWSDAKVADGTLRDHPERRRHAWISPPQPAYDEMEALTVGLMQVAHNLLPLEELIAKRTGKEMADVFAKRAAEVKAQAALGIAPPPLPGAATKPTDQSNQAGQDSKPPSRQEVAA